jgi:hypothetical protein
MLRATSTTTNTCGKTVDIFVSFAGNGMWKTPTVCCKPAALHFVSNGRDEERWSH